MANSKKKVQPTSKGGNSAKLPVIRSLPKQKLSRKQMQAIRDILGYAFQEAIKQSSVAWLLDSPPNEWANDGYKHEVEIWDTADTVARIAEKCIQKLMIDTDGNDV